MNLAVRDCLVTNYQRLIPTVTLPDPNDRHVVAAAIRANAQIIVTFNLADFPASELQQWNIEAKHPDDFLLEQIDISPQKVYAAVQRMADDRANPPQTFLDVIRQLESAGLIGSAARLRDLSR